MGETTPRRNTENFLLSNRNLATNETLEIEIMKGFLKDEFDPDYAYIDLWEVYDRTTALNTKSGAITRLTA